jgi:DNA-directed RNA polymerase subunit beta'
MVLGLYYLTKPKVSQGDLVIKGQGMKFYSSEEVLIAMNEQKLDLHAEIKVRERVDENGVLVQKLIDTTVGRVLFNKAVPQSVPFVNELLTKKNLKKIINDIIRRTDFAVTADFLDGIKELGYYWSFKGGLSFNLGDLIIPKLKETVINNAQKQVDDIVEHYNMGLITNNERYNQTIDKWTFADNMITNSLMKELSSDKQGFNSVYMMLDSGARGSKQQIKQLCGLRGLMAKPRKSGDTGGAIIENPILSSFIEGLSVLEYFISTHGARKGLADTALKTADAGILDKKISRCCSRCCNY